MSTEESLSKIQKNWATFVALTEKAEDPAVNSLIEELGERLAMCPCENITSGIGCYPGGLIDVSLRVVNSMRQISKAMGFDISISSLLKVGLLHQIGKVGDLEQDLFLDEDSDWHREKLGRHYKYNENLQKMSVSHRTHYLLQSFGVKLTPEEWIAIQISGGSHFEENRFYAGSETDLGVLVQTAASLVRTRDKSS